jgi:hypothetical protein
MKMNRLVGKFYQWEFFSKSPDFIDRFQYVAKNIEVVGSKEYRRVFQKVSYVIL